MKIDQLQRMLELADIPAKKDLTEVSLGTNYSEIVKKQNNNNIDKFKPQIPSSEELQAWTPVSVIRIPSPYNGMRIIDKKRPIKVLMSPDKRQIYYNGNIWKQYYGDRYFEYFDGISGPTSGSERGELLNSKEYLMLPDVLEKDLLWHKKQKERENLKENSDNSPTKFFAPNKPSDSDKALTRYADDYDEKLAKHREMQKEKEDSKVSESNKQPYSKKDLENLGVKFADEDSEATIKSVCNLFDTMGLDQERRVQKCNDMLEKYRNRGKN
jgi:hypothetical protein